MIVRVLRKIIFFFFFLSFGWMKREQRKKFMFCKRRWVITGEQILVTLCAQKKRVSTSRQCCVFHLSRNRGCVNLRTAITRIHKNKLSEEKRTASIWPSSFNFSLNSKVQTFWMEIFEQLITTLTRMRFYAINKNFISALNKNNYIPIIHLFLLIKVH